MLGNGKLNFLLALAALVGIAGLYFSNFKVLAEDDFDLEKILKYSQVVEQTFLVPAAEPPYPEVVDKVKMVITAYSSEESQTDDTPFITACGERVADGIVANNLLPFGTAIRIPELFGDKIFLVKDRMHYKKGNYHIDVWFQSTEQAKQFGAVTTSIEILSL